jgi:hypothetical protein
MHVFKLLPQQSTFTSFNPAFAIEMQFKTCSTFFDLKIVHHSFSKKQPATIVFIAY